MRKWEFQRTSNLEKLNDIFKKILIAKQQQDEDLIKNLQGHLLLQYGIKMTFEDE